MNQVRKRQSGLIPERSRFERLSIEVTVVAFRVLWFAGLLAMLYAVVRFVKWAWE